MANDDLDKYHKALEKALLAFHTNKMADINKIVKELWQKTYRGQDIDYIQIKADSEGLGTSRSVVRAGALCCTVLCRHCVMARWHIHSRPMFTGFAPGCYVALTTK